MIRTTSRLIAAITVIATGALVSPIGVEAGSPFPSVIELPDGFSPEGIAIDGRDAYTGSLVTGQIAVVDLKSGETSQFAPSPGPGKISVGMDVDRDGRLWVAGGGGAFFPGVVAGYRVYDTAVGDLLVDVALPGAGFVNDVIVTRDAAWFTDTFAPFVYRVPINRDGTIGTPEAVALGGDWEQSPAINANGIVATADGKHLVIAQTNAPDGAGSALYVVPADAAAPVLAASRIDLDGEFAGADGLVLIGRTLHSVGSPDGVTKIELSGDLTHGEVVGTRPVPGAVSPTTADVFGSRLYVVDANFPALGNPASEHTITAVGR